MDTDRSPIFTVLVWGGTMLTLVGLVLLLWCIFRVRAARKTAVNDDELRAVLQSIIPMNLGALCLCALGLMSVVIGVSLG